MKGARKQYRIVVRRAWPHDDDEYETVYFDKRRFGSRAQAEKRLLIYGPEPWKAFDIGPDDHWCDWGPYGRKNCENPDSYSPEKDSGVCNHPERTARQFFSEKRAGFDGRLVEVWIEDRFITPWSKPLPSEEGK